MSYIGVNPEDIYRLCEYFMLPTKKDIYLEVVSFHIRNSKNKKQKHLLDRVGQEILNGKTPTESSLDIIGENIFPNTISYYRILVAEIQKDLMMSFLDRWEKDNNRELMKSVKDEIEFLISPDLSLIGDTSQWFFQTRKYNEVTTSNIEKLKKLRDILYKELT